MSIGCKKPLLVSRLTLRELLICNRVNSDAKTIRRYLTYARVSTPAQIRRRTSTP